MASIEANLYCLLPTWLQVNIEMREEGCVHSTAGLRGFWAKWAAKRQWSLRLSYHFLDIRQEGSQWVLVACKSRWKYGYWNWAGQWSGMF